MNIKKNEHKESIAMKNSQFWMHIWYILEVAICKVVQIDMRMHILHYLIIWRNTYIYVMPDFCSPIFLLLAYNTRIFDTGNLVLGGRMCLLETFSHEKKGTVHENTPFSYFDKLKVKKRKQSPWNSRYLWSLIINSNLILLLFIRELIKFVYLPHFIEMWLNNFICVNYEYYWL